MKFPRTNILKTAQNNAGKVVNKVKKVYKRVKSGASYAYNDVKTADPMDDKAIYSK